MTLFLLVHLFSFGGKNCSIFQQLNLANSSGNILIFKKLNLSNNFLHKYQINYQLCFSLKNVLLEFELAAEISPTHSCPVLEIFCSDPLPFCHFLIYWFILARFLLAASWERIQRKCFEFLPIHRCLSLHICLSVSLWTEQNPRLKIIFHQNSKESL